MNENQSLKPHCEVDTHPALGFVFINIQGI